MMTERKITRETVEWLKTKNPLRSTLLDFEMAALRTEYPKMLIGLLDNDDVVLIGGEEKKNVAKVAAYLATELNTDGKVYAPSDVIISDAGSKFYAGLGMTGDMEFWLFLG